MVHTEHIPAEKALVMGAVAVSMARRGGLPGGFPAAVIQCRHG
jgi:hypothetical protein